MRESSYGRLQQQPLAASAPAQAEDDTEWWYMGRDNSQNGPVDSNELLQLLDGGHVHEHTYVWAGSGEWTPLSKTALFAARGVSEVSINEASSASGGERSLPPGWVQTPEGYYWNKNTQQTTWELPGRATTAASSTSTARHRHRRHRRSPRCAVTPASRCAASATS